MAVTLDGQQVPLSAEALTAFRTSMRGEVLTPDESGYDEARRVWNGMHDKYPALIARCTGTADVVACVNFAREQDVLVSVRGGGHNVAGNAVCDGGLVIDLSTMRGIHVDPANRTARVQPGVRWGDLDRETQLFGLAIPGGEISTTGVAGFTLGGGLGLLRRKWGLTCDNLLSAEVVTADGQVLAASEAEHSDLFWAIRGGGGNFGVVTSFQFRLHPLGPEVYLAVSFYPFEQSSDILRAFRSFSENAPNEVSSDVFFWSIPPIPDFPSEMHGEPAILLAGLYAGPASEGAETFRPLVESGTPFADLSGISSYVRAQSDFDALFPEGDLYYWKSISIDDLSDRVIESLVKHASERPSSRTMIAVRDLGGRISEIPEDGAAYSNRSARYNISLDAAWEAREESEHNIAWTRAAWQQLRDLTGGGTYVNFGGFLEESEETAHAAYQSKYDQLREVKRRYDPTNLFRMNVNIKP